MRSFVNRGSSLKLYSYLIALVAGSVFFANNASAAACDTATMITSVPYYVTSPGTYCLADSITFKTTSNSSISAITVSASDVDLDLNGNAIKGRWARTGSTTGLESGITITGYVTNVRIHNGSIVGLLAGVSQWTNTGSTTASNVVIEDLNFVDIKGIGVSMGGTTCDQCYIQNNAFYNMSSALCSTDCSTSYVYAINVRNFTNSVIRGNTIMGLTTYGDVFPAYAIYIYSSSDVYVENNTITDEPFSPTNNTAILAGSSTNINIAGNTISNMYKGIWYFYASGTYSGTAYVNVQVPYTGGTAGSGNQ